MKKTSEDITTDIYNALADSNLAESVTGEVYHEGERPRDSVLEDITVGFITGTVGDIQRGSINILIYVPDIDPYANGVYTKNGNRTTQIARLAQNWVETLVSSLSCYLFRLETAIYTDAEPDIRQHTVVVRLSYKYYD